MVVVLVGVQDSMIADGNDYSRHSVLYLTFLYMLTTSLNTCLTTEAWRASLLWVS